MFSIQPILLAMHLGCTLLCGHWNKILFITKIMGKQGRATGLDGVPRTVARVRSCSNPTSCWFSIKYSPPPAELTFKHQQLPERGGWREVGRAGWGLGRLRTFIIQRKENACSYNQSSILGNVCQSTLCPCTGTPGLQLHQRTMLLEQRLAILRLKGHKARLHCISERERGQMWMFFGSINGVLRCLNWGQRAKSIISPI